MKRHYKVPGIILALLGVGVVVLALSLSRNSPCPSTPALPATAHHMRAIVYRCYGPPEVLKQERVAKPRPAADEVLVRVHAAAVNPLDWHYMRGEPYIMRMESGFGRPKSPQLGVDFAGTVEAVGGNVRRFKPGDAVFGGGDGAFAEYVVVREDRALVPKPENVTFEQAASVPIAAITALQALRDSGRIQPGQKVLINGASGGVGTFAVQLAKVFGAEVTGVCSTRNVEMVRALGADHVVDYTREDFTRGAQRYDLILDMVGNRGLLEARRVLKPEGIFVIVGGPAGRWLGPLAGPIKGMLLSPFVGQEFAMMMATLKQEDLAMVAGLMKEGKVTPVIDRRYPFSEVAQAIRYLEEGRARGKVIINLLEPFG